VQSTSRNLGLIRGAREARNEDAKWIEAIENELQSAADALKPGRRGDMEQDESG
jgi:hypothetical protein